MATYGEPNYKFPTLARAVPNVTTGGTIMATVDLDKVKQLILDSAHTPCSESGTACQARRVLPALIRRVERLTMIIEDTIHELESDENRWPADNLRRALKEEPDSVG